MGSITGFAGYECEDIVLYLARILTGLGKRVAIVDRTEQEMLLELLGIPKQKEMEQEVRKGEYDGIFITNQGTGRDEYDFIFLLFGYRLMHPKLFECETLIMVTDGMPAHAALLRKIGQWDRKQCLVIRNLVAMKHSEQYLAMLAGSEEHYCSVFYEEQDMRVRYGLGSGNGCEIRHLSKEMKRLLVLLMQVIDTACEEKEIQRVIKRA